MKKLLFVLASSVLLLASCGGTPASSGTASSESETSTRSTRTRPSTSSDTSEEITSSSTEGAPSSQSSASSSTSVEPSVPEGKNIAYIEGVKSGGEAAAYVNPGFLYEWHGDGGNVTSWAYKNGAYELEYAAGWAWYGVQVFLQLPYAETGDALQIYLELNTDIAGDITINGNVVSLKKGDNKVLINSTQTAGKASLSMQLGVYDGEALAGMTFKLKTIGIYDAAATYHNVKFQDGDKLLKEIEVRDGKTVAAPIVVAPTGKYFAGWYDASSERLTGKTEIKADKVYTVKYVTKEEANIIKVEFYLGDKLTNIQDVVEFGTPDFAALSTPFGYEVIGWYTDPALTTPYDDEPIEEETKLYAKANVKMVTYRHDSVFNEGQEITHGANGEFILTYPDHGYEQGWHIQANFEGLPHADSDTYQFSVEYKLDAAGAGSYQIYSDGTVPDSNGELTVTSEWKKITVTYLGSEVEEGNKFTMELGMVHPVDPTGNVVLQVRNPFLDIVH